MDTAKTLNGNPVSAGIAVGTPYFYEAFIPAEHPAVITADQVPAQKEIYENALLAAGRELEALVCRMQRQDPEKSKIFEAHQDILNDVAMKEDILQSIDSLSSAFAAVQQVFESYIALMQQVEDATIQERAMDLKDVCSRLLRCLEGKAEQDLAALDEPVILVVHDLLPSDSARLRPDRVLAIVGETGGPTSHSAIIARSYGIPAVLGVADAMKYAGAKGPWIVDAQSGSLYLEPTAPQLEEYEKKREAFRQEQLLLADWLPRKAQTKDGVRVETELNLGRMTCAEKDAAPYCDGVGLLRTEFLYMGRPDLPGEEEQTAFYSQVLRQFAGRPVTIRTLDIGGDKKLDSMELPKEENPFLGNRALRLCLQHTDLFKTQLRACLRASTAGNLWLMFPMVGSVQDFRRAKAVLEQAKQELDVEKIPYDANIKVGIMVEIPSIALMADKAAQEADFASIGTNDLTQYTMAADRMNPALSEYCKMYNPPVFRLIDQVVRAFHAAGKPVGVCGEMGGDPFGCLVLAGLGIDKLSMGLSHLALVKKNLAQLPMAELRQIANKILNLDTAEQAEAFMKSQWSKLC